MVVWPGLEVQDNLLGIRYPTVFTKYYQQPHVGRTWPAWLARETVFEGGGGRWLKGKDG